MKFRNITSDELTVSTLAFTVAPGDVTPELTDEQAAGFVEQTDVWRAEDSKTPSPATPTVETPATDGASN